MKNSPVIAWGLILIATAWALAAVIISFKYQQKSFLLISSLAILALLSAISGIIMVSRLLPPVDDKLKAQCEADVQLATLIHLGGLSGYFIPLANLLLPFWLWRKHRGKSRFIQDAGLQALNFQLTCSVYFLGALMLVPLLVGFVILPVVIAYQVIFTLRAALAARRHEPCHYPGNLKFITEN